MSEKWEKEKRNLSEEHKKAMTKLQKDMDAESERLQKERDEMVSCKNKQFHHATHEREEKMEEDPRRGIIRAAYFFCIQFTCKKLYLSLALAYSLLRGRKILARGFS